MASTKPYRRNRAASAQRLPDAGTVDVFRRSRLRVESQAFQGTGGVSAENRQSGFEPAFVDVATGHTYRSCFADGRKAPVHVLDGLPDEIVVARSSAGRVFCAKSSVRAGFLRQGRFYSREEVAQTFASKAGERRSAPASPHGDPPARAR